MSNRMQGRIDRRLAAVDWTATDARRALETIRGEAKLKPRLTFAMALVLALLLLCATAFAVTGAVQAWLNEVADMQADGVFTRWELAEKLRFLTALRETGLTMDEDDFALLADETQPDDARNAAADRLIDARYGDLMREDAANWIQPPDTVEGLSPDPILVFKEAYLREHPAATAQEYADALGYWLREVSARAAEELTAPAPSPAAMNEALAVEAAQGYLTEVLSWSAEAAADAEIRATYRAEYKAWECTASVAKSELTSSFEPVVDEPWVIAEGERYVARMVVDETGRAHSYASAEEYAAARAAAPVWNYDADACREIALEGVAAAYGLSREQAERFFIGDGDVYRDESGNAMKALLFKAHNTSLSTDWAYAAIVNAGTGELVDTFTPDDLWQPDRLDRLATAYPNLSWERRVDYLRWYGVTYNPEGGFCGWSVEHKAAFCARFKSLADAELAANPDYFDPAVEATRRVYGTPGQDDLPQAKAVVLARRAGEQALGLLENALDAWDDPPECSFDVTDPARPVWRFMFGTAIQGDGAPWRCAVYLDARTGEVLQAFDPFAGEGWPTVEELL